MNEPKFTRFPFFPLSYGSKHMAVPRELMIDYMEGDLYVKSKDGLTEMKIASHESIKHITDYNNPHKVTKDQLGLGEVIDVEQASEEDFQKHIVANNPHKIGKTTIGLGKVRNYDIATVQDIIDCRPDKYITPEIMIQAIEKFGINIGQSFKLIINVNPNDAIVEVEIDGVYVIGSTHILKSGVYNYRISKTGFDTVEASVAMNSDTVLNINLEGVKFNVEFVVDPIDSKVEVFINGIWQEVDYNV